MQTLLQVVVGTATAVLFSIIFVGGIILFFRLRDWLTRK